MSLGFDRTALDALLRERAPARLLAVLNRDGEETRMVGGAVRNALLGRPVHEIDFATTALPEVTRARAEAAGLKAVPTGLEHGTYTIVVDHAPFEVTTLREDVETFGRRAVVRFGRDFAADARRRDFTINALSVGADGEIFDYTGGLSDLAARRVRFIGDPDQRIREDYLRILRFFRFHAEYGEGAIDPEGFAAAVRRRGGLSILSRERIRAEILKLMGTRRAVEVVGLIADAGFAAALLGVVGERGRLARAPAADPLLRLAAFAVYAPEDADRLRDSLRLSNAEHARLAAFARMLAHLRSRDGAVDGIAMRQLAVEHGMEPLADALAVLRGEPRPVVTPEALAVLNRHASGAEPLPAFPLRGADLIAAGIPKGPAVGEALASLRRLWIDEGVPDDREVRDRLLARLAQGVRASGG